MYTIIPDLHADYERLERSLEHVGSDAIFFLGDLIDAGSATETCNDLKVLKKVRSLMENHGAQCILGNHELNAILFHRKSKVTGEFFRSHDQSKTRQHQSFIEAFGVATHEALEWTSWMLNKMPLWIDLPGLRLVHAQWDHNAIKEVAKRRPKGYLKFDDLEEVAQKKTAFAKAVEILTTGAEFPLPNKASFKDKNGTTRTRVRLAWWMPKGTTWKEAALSVDERSQLPNTKVPDHVIDSLSYKEIDSPVLVGHYKIQGPLRILYDKATSIDFPNTFCVYKWNGEKVLTNENLIKCEK